MEIKIIQNFKGIINGVEINNEKVFYTTEYILENINDKFGEVYNNKFIEDMSSSISEVYRKNETLLVSEIEREFISCIERAEKFSKIKFEYLGSDYRLQELNKKISSKEYLKNEELKKERRKRNDKERSR